MEEPPARVVYRLGRIVEETAEDVAADAVRDHEQRLHLPAPERGPLTAIPFPHHRMADAQIARVREMLELGATTEEICLAVDQPVSVIERCMAEFKPRWRRFLSERDLGA